MGKKAGIDASMGGPPVKANGMGAMAARSAMGPSASVAPAPYSTPKTDATNYGYEGPAIGAEIAAPGTLREQPALSTEQWRGSPEELAFKGRMNSKGNRTYENGLANGRGNFREREHRQWRDSAQGQFDQRTNAPQEAWKAEGAALAQQGVDRQTRADNIAAQQEYFQQNPSQQRLMQQESTPARSPQQRSAAQAEYLRSSGLNQKAPMRTNVPSRVANKTNSARSVQGATARPGAPSARG